jgi:hypothetical protein
VKSTTLSSKCFSGARGLSHAGIKRGAVSAHMPERRQTAASRGLDPAPRVTASGQHLGYVEAPVAPEAGGEIQPLPAGARHVLHLDADPDSAMALASLLAPEAKVSHAATLDEARRLLLNNVFSLVIVDPALPDGDPRVLLPLLAGTPLLVHSASQPEWRDVNVTFLPKPWTSPRQLWLSISTLLGVPGTLAAGD